MRKILSVLCFTFINFLYAQTTQVSVQLPWLHQFQFAGFYAAIEKGYYKEVGLDVTIKEFAPGVDYVDDVVHKKADFGVGRSSLLVQAAKGKPIVGLMAHYQHSPLVLISTNPQVQKIQDLKNRRVMITSDAERSASLVSMLVSQGVRKNDYVRMPHSTRLQDLIDGKTDAMACYVSNEPHLLRNQKIPYTLFDPKDYGFDFYGDILFTSKETIKNNPQMVQDFYSATKKGWLYAFSHIAEISKLIYQKYNTQNKSLDSLVFEGLELKKLAFTKGGKFGVMDKNRLREISNIYKISGIIQNNYDPDNFSDTVGLTKQKVRVGVLAKRGAEKTLQKWKPLMEYLSDELLAYDFVLTPLKFVELGESIKLKRVDFLLINTMNYVQFEQLYGISRLATLKNLSDDGSEGLTRFGGVIFTLADNDSIDSLKDVKSKKFGAVNKDSFGGWVMALKELQNAGVSQKDFEVHFFNTHDNTVFALLNHEVDVATVRTDTLEKMIQEGSIKQENIKILGLKHDSSFPYAHSTQLYPEWPFTKLNHTSDELANDVLSKLLAISPSMSVAKQTQIYGWTIPLDYSSVYKTLHDLQIFPFEQQPITFADIFNEYKLAIIGVVLMFILVLFGFIYNTKMKKNLDKQVKQRTQELTQINEKLEELATTDELTGISNRRDFLNKFQHALVLSKRNQLPLALLSLDIDHFKRVNDNYGHDVGDKVLQLVCEVITQTLRATDIFGRIGGEEFSVLLQNTDQKGAMVIAHKIKNQVQKAAYTFSANSEIRVTISIGIALFDSEADGVDTLLKRADIAMYKAKENGRNRVELA